MEKGHSLEEITQTTKIVNDMNTQIATAAEQQSVVADEIDKNSENINVTSKKSATSAIHIAHSSEQLSNLSSHLQKLTSQFKI